MGVFGHQEMATEALNPVFWRSEKIHLFFVVFFLFMAFLFLRSHVAGVLRRLAPIEDGWVIPAMKGNVRLAEEMIGKESPAIPKDHFQHVARIASTAPR